MFNLYAVFDYVSFYMQALLLTFQDFQENFVNTHTDLLQTTQGGRGKCLICLILISVTAKVSCNPQNIY